MHRSLAASLIAAIAAGIAAGPAVAADEVALPADQRTALSLSIYADGWALIWDRRAATLVDGANRVAFEGVSRQMLPSSAMLEAAPGLRLVDIDYNFALLTPDALLRRSLGKTVGVVRMHPTTGEETIDKATVLAVSQGVVLKIGDRVETSPPGRLVFYDLPADLRAQPTMLATVASDGGGRKELGLGYLTRGLGWAADYVAQWDTASSRIDLTGRATLTNTTGVDFPGADVALIAGSVRREEQPVPAAPPEAMGRMRAAPMMADAKAMPVRETFADLHLYRVPGKVGLADQQTRQVTLLAANGLPVTRDYVSEAGIAAFRQGGEPQPTHPEVRLRFAAGQPGSGATPLPAGIIRVYATSGEGPPRLVGEDRIDHTPAGAPVTVSPGEAFDVTVLRRQTDFKTAGLPENVSESAWTIEVRNASGKAATVRIVEIAPGDWTVLSETAPHEKQTVDRLVWQVTAPPNGSAQLSYRVRVQL